MSDAASLLIVEDEPKIAISVPPSQASGLDIC